MSALPRFNPNRSDGARFVETHGGQKTDISIFGQGSNPTTRRLDKMKRPIQRCELSATNKQAQSPIHSAHPTLVGSVRVFFAPKRRQSPTDHKAMNAIFDQAVGRFKHLQTTEVEEAELWRCKLQAFRNLFTVYTNS